MIIIGKSNVSLAVMSFVSLCCLFVCFFLAEVLGGLELWGSMVSL